MKNLWYNFFRYYIKTGLFFYTKKIKIVGRDNIPKKGAVLFVVNHPNGLLDPLVVTTNTPRITHYLVRAAVFKKPLVKKMLATLNLMPIYRIRDGINQLSKNEGVFNDCYTILNNQEALMIFAEGSHDRRRTVRTLSKGFTRIIFGALNTYPDLKITIIPVGITYQNSGAFPCKAAIHYGTGISAKELYNPNELNTSVNAIKEEVSTQLKKLSVHIPYDENYEATLNKLNTHNVDFTEVQEVNKMITSGNMHSLNATFSFGKLIRPIFIINSIIPWILWKLMSKKIDEIEFLDTFRFGLGISIFPIFYILQTIILYRYSNVQTAGTYLALTGIIALLHSKTAATPAE